MKKQDVVFFYLFCAVFLLCPLISFGAKEVPQSAAGVSFSSNAGPSEQAKKSEQEEIKNVNQNSGDTQNKETEKEQVGNQGGSETEVNSQIVSGIIPKNGSDGGVGSANQSQIQTQVQQGEFLGQGKEEENQRSLERRSRVAAAILEMERIGDANQGLGEQVRTIAQAQNEGQDKIETTLQTVQNRNRVVKFLVGPDYKKIKNIEAELETQQTRIQEMVRLANQLENDGDAQTMKEQIALLQDVEDQIRQELYNEQTGMNLFGWLFKWFAR